MLDQDIIYAGSKKEFDDNVGNYFVNMTNNVRTLHKTYNRSCYYSNSAYRFISFDTHEDVEKYEKMNKNSTPFKRCGNCFKTR